MRRWIAIAALLLLPCIAGGQGQTCAPDTCQQIALVSGSGVGVSGVGSGAGAAVGCDAEPAGDIATEGFETPGFELSWAETGTVVDDQSLAAYTGATGYTSAICNYGHEVTSTGTAGYSTWDNGSGLASAGYFLRATILLVSHSLSTGNAATIFASGTTGCGTNQWGAVQIIFVSPTLYIRGTGASNSTTDADVDLTIGQWHQIDACIPDGGDVTNFCTAAGGNSYGWVKVDGGTAKEFQANNLAAQRYFCTGVITASRTLDVIVGYYAIDDDGTF